MIDMQLLSDALVTVAVLIGVAVTLAVAIMAAARVSRPGQAPHGGIRRDLPLQPQPDADADDARELVLL